MDPNMLGGMAEMFKNPEMMKSMEAMMENPEMQKMLNDPSMISNMMNILGGAGINMPNQPPNMPSNTTTNESIEESQPKYQSGDIVVLHNLKKEEYNNLQGTIVSYLEDSDRYVVLLENDKKLSVRESNLKNKEDDELEIVD